MFNQAFNNGNITFEDGVLQITNYDELEKEFNKRMAIQSTTDKSYRAFLDEIYKFKTTQDYTKSQLLLPPMLESPKVFEDLKKENIE